MWITTRQSQQWSGTLLHRKLFSAIFGGKQFGESVFAVTQTITEDAHVACVIEHKLRYYDPSDCSSVTRAHIHSSSPTGVYKQKQKALLFHVRRVTSMHYTCLVIFTDDSKLLSRARHPRTARWVSHSWRARAVAVSDGVLVVNVENKRRRYSET